MIKKAFQIIVIVFICQLLISCWCDCDDESYEVFYESVDLIAYDTSGFQVVNVEGEVYKSSFGLGINLDTRSVEVAAIDAYKKIASFGFTSAYATSCDCLYEETFPNNITSITIFMIDESTSSRTDFTENFKVASYNDEFITI